MVIFVLLHLFNALCFRAKKIVGSPPVLPLASLLNVKAAVVLGRSKREIPIQQSMTQSLKLLFHTDVLMTFEIKKKKRERKRGRKERERERSLGQEKLISGSVPCQQVSLDLVLQCWTMLTFSCS